MCCFFKKQCQYNLSITSKIKVLLDILKFQMQSKYKKKVVNVRDNIIDNCKTDKV